MPRLPRYTEIGYYHLINRVVEKRDVFLDNDDHRMFLSILEEHEIIHHFVTHAYCLMSNHYHLLIEIKLKNLSLLMQQINYKYSIYFNNKYNRVGHLWQGRFKSWFIYDVNYLHTVTKYIEQNPIRAGLTNKIGEFSWASSTTHENSLTNKELQNLNILHTLVSGTKG